MKMEARGTEARGTEARGTEARQNGARSIKRVTRRRDSMERVIFSTCYETRSIKRTGDLQPLCAMEARGIKRTGDLQPLCAMEAIDARQRGARGMEERDVQHMVGATVRECASRGGRLEHIAFFRIAGSSMRCEAR